MVEVGTGTAGTRFIKTDWPIYDEDNHLTAGTTKLSDEPNLKAEKDLTSDLEKEGVY